MLKASVYYFLLSFLTGFRACSATIPILQSALSSLPRPYVHFIMWNRDEAKCPHTTEWQKPSVTWINSCTYDGALAMAKGALQSSYPHPHTTQLTTSTPPAPYCCLPSGLLHEAHSSVQCWALISDGTSVLQATTKYTGSRLSRKTREAGGLSDGGARWRVASKADVMKLDLHSRSL